MRRWRTSAESRVQQLEEYIQTCRVARTAKPDKRKLHLLLGTRASDFEGLRAAITKAMEVTQAERKFGKQARSRAHQTVLAHISQGR